MIRTHFRTVIQTLLALVATVVWAFVLWMACHVSLIILQTLEQIVDLAAIAP